MGGEGGGGVRKRERVCVCECECECECECVCVLACVLWCLYICDIICVRVNQHLCVYNIIYIIYLLPNNTHHKYCAVRWTLEGKRQRSSKDIMAQNSLESELRDMGQQLGHCGETGQRQKAVEGPLSLPCRQQA